MREKVELVKELISIAEDNDLAELSIDFKGIKVDIKKEKQAPAPMMVSAMPMGGMPMAAAGFPDAKAAVEKPREPVASGVPVKSPLSGVFYRAPKPGAPPFVKEGDLVEQGQTLCIVEAMKLMNEISAEIRGKVSSICKENGEIANQDEIIMYLEPSV